MTNSYYDIRPAVLHGDRKHGSLKRYADTMVEAVEACDTPFPKSGLCMVSAGSPRPYKSAVETLAVCFVRELGYDFRPFTVSEYSNRIYRRADERTTDGNTRSFLWFNTAEGHPGHWATFGACTFRLKGDHWRLMWVWMHPYERRKGHLRMAWPFFRSMFGVFLPEPPYSVDFLAFMRKLGYDDVIKRELEPKHTPRSQRPRR